MEIRLRPLVVALIVLALVGALGYFAWPRLLPLAARINLHPAATPAVPSSNGFCGHWGQPSMEAEIRRL